MSDTIGTTPPLQILDAAGQPVQDLAYSGTVLTLRWTETIPPAPPDTSARPALPEMMPTAFEILRILKAEHPVRITQVQIAEKLESVEGAGCSDRTVRTHLAWLKRKGLVKQRQGLRGVTLTERALKALG
jgi:hypothetical protein